MMDRKGQRLRINLSRHAVSTIESDKSSFGVEDSLGGFVSRVFESFESESDASIAASSRRYREQLVREVQLTRYRAERPGDTALEYFEEKKTPLSDMEMGVIDTLVAHRADRLVKWLNSLEKGGSSLIRIRDSVYARLYPEGGGRWEEEPYYGKSRSAFLKALMEDYASKTNYEREAIVFRGRLDELAVAIGGDARDRFLVTLKRGSREYDVKPYAVMPDEGWNYHYLVGVGRPSDSTSPFKPVSFRVSRIDNVRIRPKSYASGKITKTEMGELADSLRKKGVQYLVGNEALTIVRLSEEGVKRFAQILHGRPEPTSRIDDEAGVLLSFDCTERQVSNYFFEFGADALILEPESTREGFRDRYRAAFEHYDYSGADDGAL